MHIDGFGVGGYRSFLHPQRLGPLGRINLLVGQNNVGKSNILRFVTTHGKAALDGVANGRSTVVLGDDDRPAGAPRNQDTLVFDIAIAHGSLRYTKALEHLEKESAGRDALKRVLERISDADGVAWVRYRLGKDTVEPPPEYERTLTEDQAARHELHAAWTGATRRTGGELKTWTRELFGWIAARGADNPPPISCIPAIREVKNTGQPKLTNDHSGLNLVHELARLQNPTRQERELREKFTGLNNFLRGVLDTSDAQLEVSHDKSQLLVHLNGLTLPIEDIGTGIHEVVILATAATVLEGHLLCIEEPEVHLHPLLQRKLVSYLVSATSNNYLIATHSAHLIDASPEALIVHATREADWTRLGNASNTAARVAICQDLGYRASDLLQTNAVVWVEGPSDRIYLRRWLQLADPSLIEGIHYSIMFYGGRLLSHLTAHDDEVTEFINLRRINQHMAILIDSDKPSARAGINDTKKRLISEIGAEPGFAWVTRGREIENYVDPIVLLDAIQTCHPKAVRLQSPGQYDHALHYTDKHGKTHSAEKVRVAHAVVAKDVTLEPHDLRSQVNALVRFVRVSNGFQIEP